MKLLNLFLLSVVICVPSVAQKSLPAIRSRAQFDALSVTYDANTPYALPHINFVIDRKNGNKIYYVNKKRFPFHKDFVNFPTSTQTAASSSAPSHIKRRSSAGPSSFGKAI